MRKIWLLFAISAGAWATPLHLDLHCYEGLEYDCTVDHGMVWYTYRSQQLAPRRLSKAEQKRLQSLLDANFPGLPPRMREPAIDSTWTLRCAASAPPPATPAPTRRNTNAFEPSWKAS